MVVIPASLWGSLVVYFLELGDEKKATLVELKVPTLSEHAGLSTICLKLLGSS